MKERWRNVQRSALWSIVRMGLGDVNTLAKGEGPIADFERSFAELTQTRYALAMNSGTATLHSAYFALGIGPGSEVIVPAYTFFATATPAGAPPLRPARTRRRTSSPARTRRTCAPSWMRSTRARRCRSVPRTRAAPSSCARRSTSRR